MNLHRTTLDNGLQVILHETHVAPVASFWLYYRVGSRNEATGFTGISHWVEHMLFKGTEQFPQGEFDRAVARAGGLANGMTSQDWTTYFETFPSDRIKLALQVESDRMANAIFAPDEVESERSVILSEREGSENSYFWLLHEEVQAAAFHAHGYAHPVIGWRSDLLTMQRDDLHRHYRTFYTPNNAVAVAVGDFTSGAMLERIEQTFGALPQGPSLPTVTSVEPPQAAERRVLMRGPEPMSYMIIAVKAPQARHPDFFPLTVLDAVLGGSKGMGLFGGGGNNRSSRLYRGLVNQQLAVSADSSYSPTIDPFLFSFYVTLAPGIGHQQVEDAIWAEIDRIQRHGITQEELDKAIKQTKAQFAFSRESVTDQAYWLGFSEVVATADWLERWLYQLTAVTLEDVQRVAVETFDRRHQTVGWYLPEEGMGG